MPRASTFLIALAAATALPASAGAAVTPSVADGTLTITGDAAADQLVLTGDRASLQVADGNQRFAISRSRFSSVVIRSGAGNDVVRIDDTANLSALAIETGAGADVVTGSQSAETIETGDDADLVTTGGGEDTVALGAGDDIAIQSAADALDRIDGGAGIDTLRALGTDEQEEFTLQSLGDHARISRDTSPAVAEVRATEIADVRAAAGADLVDIGDLTGSGVQRVNADVGASDGAPDQVAAHGSAANEFVSVGPSSGTVVLSGLAQSVFLQILGSRATDDRLTLFAGAGRDSISATAALGTLIGLTVDGGPGATPSPGPTRPTSCGAATTSTSSSAARGPT